MNRTQFLSLLLVVCCLFSACRSSRQPAAKPSPPRPSSSTPPPSVKPATTPQAVPQTTATEGIAWLDSERLMPVLEYAQSVKKPVFVHFHASWCAPCKVMEEEIYPQAQVRTLLNEHFLCFRADYDQAAGRTIADIYEVSGLPTILFLDPQGVALERGTGMRSAAALMEMARAALGKMDRR